MAPGMETAPRGTRTPSLRPVQTPRPPPAARPSILLCPEVCSVSSASHAACLEGSRAVRPTLKACQPWALTCRRGLSRLMELGSKSKDPKNQVELDPL